MKTPKPVFVDFTHEQLLQLAALFDHAKSEAIAGRRGMILAQPRDPSDPADGRGKFRVGYCDHETATALVALMDLANSRRKS